MADEGLGADDLRTIELDDALRGAVVSRWGAYLSVYARWRLALWLMTAAGFFAWMATITPWMIVRIFPFYSSTQFITVWGENPALSELTQVMLAHFPTVGMALLFTCVQIFGALGALVGGALFMSLRPRLRTTVLLVYAAWLVAQVAQAFIASTLIASGGSNAAWLVIPRDWRAAIVTPSLGLWLGWLAAILGVAGVVLARQALRQGAAATPDTSGAAGAAGGWWQAHAARPRIERWGIVAATVGIALWFCGFFALPWLTQGCSGLQFSFSHFTSGSCSGLDSADALAQSPLFGLLAHAVAAVVARLGVGETVRSTAGTLVSPGIVILPVVALAGWALLALWGDQGGKRRYAWVAGWVVGACAAAALAFAGGQALQAYPIILNFNNISPWVYGPGLAVTLIGLALAAVGLACALAATLRDGVSGAAQASSLASASSSSRPRPTTSSVGEKI